MCYIVVAPTVTAGAKKSVVRSIRISKALDEVIRQDAEEAGLTVNSMISSILTRYAEWDRFAEPFGFVTLAREGFRALLNEIEEDRLVAIAENFAPSLARDLALHFFKRVDFDTFFRFLLAQLRYGHLAEYQVETGEQADTLTLHHELGRRWSLLLAEGIGHSFESIAKISPESAVEENTFILSFPPGTLNGGGLRKGKGLEGP